MSPLRGFGCIGNICSTIMSPLQGFDCFDLTFSSLVLCETIALPISRQQVKVKVKVSVNVILHRVTQRRNLPTLWFSVVFCGSP